MKEIIKANPFQHVAQTARKTNHRVLGREQ
jgi:hypothetical protein